MKRPGVLTCNLWCAASAGRQGTGVSEPREGALRDHHAAPDRPMCPPQPSPQTSFFTVLSPRHHPENSQLEVHSTAQRWGFDPEGPGQRPFPVWAGGPWRKLPSVPSSAVPSRIPQPCPHALPYLFHLSASDVQSHSARWMNPARPSEPSVVSPSAGSLNPVRGSSFSP